MRILAMETTTAQGSIAWMEDGELQATCDLAAGQYATQLFAAMEQVASQAGSSLGSVDGFAVANGPGSFTGVRVGLTVVKGLIEVWDKPAVAVSTLAAVLASRADAAWAESGGEVAALDAARGEVYFRVGREGEDRLESIEAFCRRLDRSERLRLVTPHAALAAACGERLGADFSRRVLLAPRRLAEAVGRLGGAELRRQLGGGRETALQLDANYVRRSDAEIFAPPPAQINAIGGE
jgi:tRNA threonylcarbamoyl adenosine modification protein YeaZ